MRPVEAVTPILQVGGFSSGSPDCDMLEALLGLRADSPPGLGQDGSAGHGCLR